MEELITYLISSFTIAFLIFPLFIKILEERKIFEKFSPRKIHTRYVPAFGGVPIVFSALIICLVFFPIQLLGELKFLFFSVIFVFILGLRDDILPLTAWVKAFNQLLPGVVVYFFFDIKIDSLFTLADIQLPVYLSLPLTCFTIVIITNSFNLIDGIDGLAGSLSILSLAVFASYFHINQHITLSYFLIAFIGALCGFLYYNVPPARIFMGDTGALIIGFILSCSAISFMKISYEGGFPEFKGTVGTAMAIIGIPLFDTFRIILLRLSKGISPLHADRNHIHHYLLDLGWSHLRISVVLFSIQLLTIAAVLLLRELGDIPIILMVGGIYFSLMILVQRLSKSKTKEAAIEQ